MKIGIVGSQSHMGRALSICLEEMGNKIVPLKKCNICWIALDTPVDEEGRGIVSSIFDAVKEVRGELKRGTLVIVSSQVPVGTSKKFVKILGSDFGYAYMPELMKIGTGVEDFMGLKQIVVGIDRGNYQRVIAKMFKGKKVDFVSVATAEMIKHANNAFLATSLCFIYDIADICEAVGADVTDVARALRSDYRIGPEAYLDASAGFSGGHLERDLDYLLNVAYSKKVGAPVINAVLVKNLSRKMIVLDALGNLKNKKVAFWGIAYKSGAPISNNSLPAKLMRDIEEAGGTASMSDPSFEETPYESVVGAKAIVCITPWNELKKLDFKKVARLMVRPKILFDARNYFKDMEDEIKKAGIKYIGVGR